MTSELVTAFTSGITTIKTDMIAMFIAVIPIALVIFGIVFVILRSKRLAKSLSK
jgi:hypothetical protein